MSTETCPYVLLAKQNGQRFLVAWDRDDISRAQFREHLVDMVLDGELDFDAGDAGYLLASAQSLDPGLIADCRSEIADL